MAFGAAANHCAFYPGAHPVRAHASELKGYDTSKGTIRFAAGRSLPASLVRKLVKRVSRSGSPCRYPVRLSGGTRSVTSNASTYRPSADNVSSFPDRREQVTGLVAKNLPNRLECRLVPSGHEVDRAMQGRMDTESGSIA